MVSGEDTTRKVLDLFVCVISFWRVGWPNGNTLDCKARGPGFDFWQGTGENNG